MENQLALSLDEVKRDLTETIGRVESLGRVIADQLTDAERELEQIKQSGIPVRGPRN